MVSSGCALPCLPYVLTVQWISVCNMLNYASTPFDVGLGNWQNWACDNWVTCNNATTGKHYLGLGVFETLKYK